MKNVQNRALAAMKKQYASPSVSEAHIQIVSILCVSGESDRINGLVHGGNNSGDITTAF